MAKIPFSIEHREKIESGEYKVEIGKSDPWPARIACWDLNGNDLIVIVSNPEGKEEGLIYTPEGKHKAYAPKIDSDLFIVTPEEEHTEWQRFISACLQKHGLLDCGAANRIAKESAAELLAIAKKAYIYAQRIDWLLSGDDGEESFHERLKEELQQLKNGEYE